MEGKIPIADKKTYRVTHVYPCCATCRHSFINMGISLLCKNPKEWVKEASVEPLGICDSYERKEGDGFCG